MKTPKICCLLTAIALAQSSLFGVSTDPVGFVSVSVPAASDAVLAVPLNRAAEFKGVIQSISGNVITVAGTPAWTANQFVQSLPSQVKTYAVQIAGGAKEGMIGRITANGTSTITVTLDSGDDLTNIGTVALPVDPDGAGPLTAQADQLDIMPYWTPSSLLSNVPAGTSLFAFTGSEVGKNFGTTLSYGYTGSNWEDGDSGDLVDHVVLPFGSAFFIRNNSASVLNLSFVGSVPMSAHRLRIRTLAANTAQEFYFGFNSPVPESITQLGIPAQAGDQIFGFNNSAPGKNKGTVVAYGFTGTIWEDADSGEPIDANTKLQPGFGYVYRRAASPTPGSVVWQKLPSYLQ